MRRLWAHRDARLYIGGQGLSTLGDSALWLAMGIYVKILTGSNSAAGLVFFAYVCGSLTAPATGLLVDRMRRRPLLVTANLATGALVCALLAVSGRGEVWLVYPVMAGYGALGGLTGAAGDALLPAMLPADLLGEANAALQLAAQGLRVLTPLLGAGLLAWLGPQPVIGLDVGTFVVAAAAVAALRVREPRPVPGTGTWRAEVTAGIRHIARTPSLRRLLVACVIALCVFGFFETIPFAVTGQGLHRTPPFMGVLEAMMGAGALAGGVLAARLMRRAGEVALAASGLVTAAVSCGALMASWLPLVLAAMGLLGLGIIWINVAALTLLQRRTPPGLLGRVSAAFMIAVQVPQAASIALGAVLVTVVNYRVLLAVMGAVVAVSGAYLARGRHEGAGRSLAGASPEPVGPGPAADAVGTAQMPGPG